MKIEIKKPSSKDVKQVILFASTLTFLAVVIKTVTKDSEKPIQKTYSDY
ncbi:hypothetical protein [Tenacibaculum dicentrarchi]